MNKYRVMILGYPVEKEGEIRHCFHMMGQILKDALLLLPNVELVVFNNGSDYTLSPVHQLNATFIRERLCEIPEVDCIIVNEPSLFFTRDMIDALKARCRKVISFSELGELSDFSFIFQPSYYKQKPENCCVVPAPYTGRFYKNVEKEKKTLLLDHSAWIGLYSLSGVIEMSDKIYMWLDGLKDDFKIYSLVSGAKQGGLALKLLPAYVTPIMPCPFVDYLEKTNRMETFVVTHKGDYNLSIIDMLVRGIQVIAYPEFLSEYLVERFGIPLYEDRNSFLSAVRKPVDKDYWNKQIEKCTSIQTLSEVLYERIKM